VKDQLSLQLAPVIKGVYQPRGINAALQLLFKKHFQSLADRYEAKHTIIYGRLRIERITEVVEKFILWVCPYHKDCVVACAFSSRVRPARSLGLYGLRSGAAGTPA
jgi:hypothetical protein